MLCPLRVRTSEHFCAHGTFNIQSRLFHPGPALSAHGLQAAIYTFKRFMQLATAMREDHPAVRTIYVAADVFEGGEAVAQFERAGWEFVYHEKLYVVEGGKAEREHEYFLKDPHTIDTIVDIEILMHADFIFGACCRQSRAGQGDTTPPRTLI